MFCYTFFRASSRRPSAHLRGDPRLAKGDKQPSCISGDPEKILHVQQITGNSLKLFKFCALKNLFTKKLISDNRVKLPVMENCLLIDNI